MRRSGKTYFLYQTIRQLLAQGIAFKHILYINLEDDRLLPMDHKALGLLIDSFFSLYPDNYNHCCYLFLDEIQNIEDWHLVIRRLFDTKNIRIYLTGSSAKLLSKEITSSLRGRSLALEIWPYSYHEFLVAHHLHPPVQPLGQKSLDILRGHLLDYFKTGGFPGIQSLPPHEHLEMLQNYVQTVVFRDIVERHQISNIALLKYLISCLLKSVGAPFSVNKFYNDISSQGLKIGKDTLYAYLKHSEDAYLIFTIPIFTESVRGMQTTPKKVYAIDNGLITANTFNMSENLGKLFENQIYLDLRRQGLNVYYYRTKEGYEIDFIAQDKSGKYEMIQVVWDSSDKETMIREERALRHAEQELGFSGKLIDYAQYLNNT